MATHFTHHGIPARISFTAIALTSSPEESGPAGSVRTPGVSAPAVSGAADTLDARRAHLVSGGPTAPALP
ncbi:hypothetical protein GCM10019017_41300 [Streptomyces showdoensis]